MASKFLLTNIIEAKNKIMTLPKSQIDSIEQSIIRAALEHLHAIDADTALSHYLPDATVITNGKRFDSFQMFENDVREFYSSLKEIKQAIWEDIQIKVISSTVAVFTAKVNWHSIDTSGSTLNLYGIWSAVYLLVQDKWKILHRHESFETIELQT